jgi:hypothetical protein
LAALSETKLAGEGQLTEVNAGYTFFWSGKAEEEYRESGVGFAIKSCLMSNIVSLPKGVSDRIITVRLALTGNQHATVISVYAPTMTHADESKCRFYEDLRNTLLSVPRHDKLILMGDFNARVGCDAMPWDGVLGKHGIGKMNSNGLLLLTLCQEFQLTITNTLFRQRNIYKGTWMHPRSRTWHMIDYVIVRRRDMSDVQITRVMRGADCWTDHSMLRSKMSLRLRRTVRPQGVKLPRRLNVDKLGQPELQEKLRTTLSQAIGDSGVDFASSSVTDHWETLKAAMYTSASDVVGSSARRHQDWFDEHDTLIQALLSEVREARNASRQAPSAQDLRLKYQNLSSTVQSMLRNMRDQWWTKKAEEIQLFADTRDLKRFYAALKEVYGPKTGAVSPVLASDGHTLIVEKEKILARWAEHFNSVLNSSSVIDLRTFASMHQEPVLSDLDLPPSVHEVESAIRSLSTGKSPGMDGIAAEVLKAGGSVIAQQLAALYQKSWLQGTLPQEFKDASVVHLYKRKGAKTACDNHRGISLLSVSGKVLSKIIARRLYQSIAEPFLSESQCGFRPNRGCVDMIFTARQLMEKCREQNLGLCAAFIDLTKAFDSVNREGLWMLLAKRGCPPKFLKMIREFHDGMCARVIEQGSVSEPFTVTNGVKQGCTMAPTLFAVYFAAMLRDAFHNSDVGVYVRYRTSGKLFNLRRLQARSKVMEALIRDLLFADDCGLFTHTVEDMQTLINCFAESSKRFGLTISIKKTQVLYLPPPHVSSAKPAISIGNDILEVVESFTYLGSTISADCSIDAEITNRISKASAAFGALTSKLWNNHNIRWQTKLQVYQAVVLSTLLYASETWTCYKKHIRQLDRFHQSCLRRILKIHWRDRVSDVEVLQRANSVGMEAMLMKLQLRWAGHVVRMDDSRLPKQVFYSDLRDGKRLPGGQKLRYKDNLRKALKKCSVDVNRWEELCADRSAWRQRIRTGVQKFESDRVSSLVENRRKRKQRDVLSAVNTFTCSVCSKVCLSRIGLVGHMRVHK